MSDTWREALKHSAANTCKTECYAFEKSTVANMFGTHMIHYMQLAEDILVPGAQLVTIC